MNEELTIAERRFGTGLILDLAGNLTRQSEEALLGRRRWDEGLAEGRNLVLNFGGVRIVNSAGIALLIRLAHAGQKAGFRIYGIGVSGHYQKMFRLIGLTEFILLYPDEYSLMLRLSEDERGGL